MQDVIYYQCSVKVSYETEDGKIKKQNESYLVEAETQALASSKIEQKMRDMLNGQDFVVTSVRASRILEIF